MSKKKQVNPDLPHFLFYNPRSGDKKSIVKPEKPVLKDVLALLDKYQIPVEPVPITSFGKIQELVTKTLKKDCKAVLVAGGDGTIGEVASALVGKDIALGIIPLGTFVNNARMIDVPLDLEKAIMIIKIGRVRKIDVGMIVRMNGEKLSKPFYFLESAGIGIEAQMHKHVLKMEKGNFGAALKLLGDMGDIAPKKMKIVLDGEKEIETEAIHVTVSNGPMAGAALHVAPKAKMNDHRLTVTIYKMGKGELLTHFMKLLQREPVPSKLITRYTAQEVRLSGNEPHDIHADGRVFGETPAKFSILPSALSVICGFSESRKDSGMK